MRFKLDTCYIEPIQTGDAVNIFNFAISNAQRLKRYFPVTLKENRTLELSKIFAIRKVKEFQSQEEFLYTLKENGTSRLIGLLYLKSLDWIKKHGELAYCIDQPFEGKGITTNAVKCISEHAFNELGLKTIKIIVHISNLASIMVAKKCNFTWIKTLKNEHTPPGERALDMELYELYNALEQ